MLKKYRQLSSGDKTKLLVVFGVLICGGYFGLWFPQLSEQADHQDSMLSRRLNRMETRLKKVEEPSHSTNKLENQFNVLDENYKQLQNQMAFLSTRFTALDKPYLLKNMRLEVSQLAAKSGMDIDQIRSAVSGDPQAAPPTAEIIALEAKNRFGRPLISLRAKSSYSGLMQFLQGLKNFSSNVSVVRLSLEANRLSQEEEQEEETTNSPQLLDIELLLAM